MMKKVVTVLIIMIFIPTIAICSPNSENESILSTDDIIKSQLDNLKIDELEELIKKINDDTNNLLPKIDFREYLIALIKGEEVVNGSEILNKIFSIVFNEVIANSALLIKLLVLTIICAVLTNLQSS